MNEELCFWNICTPPFTAALLKITKIWKQPECPSTDEWMYIYISTHVYTYIYTMEYCFATKETEVFPYATACMDLEGIMLGETNQAQKDKFHMILFIWVILKKVKSKHQAQTYKNRLMVDSGVGQAKWVRKVKIFSYKINKSWGCNILHDNCN